MDSFNGIFHNGGITNGPHIHLPLEQLVAQVLILDIACKVTLTQRFYNPSNHPTSRALYYFPVPMRAAICSFELRTSGGKTIFGTCKEKSQAQDEHENAIARGEYTGLLEWVSNDIFTISVGSIAAKETAYIKLSFVMNLMNDHDRDFIRFHLPVTVGQRYGQPPDAILDAAIPGAQTRIRINVDVQTSGTIQSITSPSHRIKIEKHSSVNGRPSRRRAAISFRSNHFFVHDFVLLVQAEKLDASRCFAEIYRDPKKTMTDTLAVQLTLVPKFNMPAIRAQEYIFLIDRSGSMNSDSRIETAKKTLTLLMRMLPKDGSSFNIFSFGSHTDSLWPRSNSYDEYSLNYATNYAQTMTADFGGTEIYLALERVFKQREMQLPTAVFMLTDGEAYDIDPVMALVRTAVHESPTSLRIYILGIGSQVSTAMCEGIAAAGDGACLFSTRAEDIAAKCARLLRAGRTPIVKNVTVDWGVPDTVLTPVSNITMSTPGFSPPSFEQAPTTINHLHADVRIVIFGMFQLRKTFAPKEVVLHGEVGDDGAPFSLVVPIRGVQLTDFEPRIPPIHTLAALHLIREHEAGVAPLPLIPDQDESESRKQAMVYLGTRYQLASRHTSFVAVEKTLQTPPKPEPPTRGLLNVLWNALGGSSASTAPATGQSSSRRTRAESSNSALQIPGGWPGSPRLPTRSLHRSSRSTAPQSEEEESDDTTESYSTMSSLEGSEYSYWTGGDDNDDTGLSAQDLETQRSPSPQLAHLSNEGATTQRPRSAEPSRAEAVLPIPEDVLELLSLQRADGSFDLSELMKNIVGVHAAEQSAFTGTDQNVWATVLCIAFLMKHLPDQTELRTDLLIKAYEFLDGHLAINRPEIDALVENAMKRVN